LFDKLEDLRPILKWELWVAVGSSNASPGVGHEDESRGSRSKIKADAKICW
jgi:hypothetical protein